MTSHYFLDLGTPEPPKYCKYKPPIHPYEGDHVMMRLQGTLPFLLLIAQAQHTTLWAIFLSRWAECSLIILFLALHETLKSLPGVDSRPHIQYFCGPKKPNLNLKVWILKAWKLNPLCTCLNSQRCLISVHLLIALIFNSYLFSPGEICFIFLWAQLCM